MEKLLVDLGLALGLFGLLTSGIYGAMVLAAAARFRRCGRSLPSPSFAPPVSLLKPLHGAEPGLEAHLGTFFEQNYPAYEILFCARHVDDAGLAVAPRLPHVTQTFPCSF